MNMSYCRFENTSHDLEDCAEALQAIAEQVANGGFETEDDDDDFNDEDLKLSEREQRKAAKLAELAVAYLEAYAETYKVIHTNTEAADIQDIAGRLDELAQQLDA